MNVLVFSPVAIYPILTGRELRYYNLWRSLAKRHPTHLIYMSQDKPSHDTKAHLRSVFASVTWLPLRSKVPGEKASTLWAKVGATISPPWDYFLEGEYSPDARLVIQTTLRERAIDGVYAYGRSVRKYLQCLGDIPVVNDIGDDPVVWTRRMIPHRRGFLGKIRAIRDWLVAVSFEKRELGHMKEVVLISSDDATVFQRLCPKTKVTVIPNGVDSDFFRPAPQIDVPATPVLLFTGVMDYEPNITAASYLCNRILPLLRREIPTISVLIVGRNPTPEVLELAEKHTAVNVTGEVDDIRAYFHRASVYVCPLLSGAGIKNKILEAWSMGLPIVATPISCEGINTISGKDILIADNPLAFAAAVKRLLADSRLRRDLIVNGREKVEREYSWDHRAVMIERIFERLLGSP